ncbi:MAG: polyprenyl diphosphate synthase [Acidimicrobiales bacterium]
MITPTFDRDTISSMGLDPDGIPAHIAVVMDGNGRWAQERGLKRTEGHIRGEDALFECIEGALELGVQWVTVYAFSTENWRRPKEEVKFIVNFNRDTLRRRRDELHERDVRIRSIGRRNWRMPKGLLRVIDDSVELTADNKRMTFTIAFNYGGRAEIVDAVRAMSKAGVDLSKLDERALAANLYEPDMPDPDLVIRTSGESRLSNFLLWQAAYSEFLFLDSLWPDFTRESVYDAVHEYQRRSRRYGGL